MIESTRLKRKSYTATQKAKTGGVYFTNSFVHLGEYYLPDAFDILRRRRDLTRVRNAQNESAR